MARRVIILSLFCALLAALGQLVALHAQSSSHASRHASGLRSVTIGMGYVPSVQFAPFYVAQQRGYYRRVGLDVHFSYGFSPNLLQLVGAGRDDFAIADGTDAIAAVAAGIPVTYVAGIFQRLPVAVFSLKKSGIRKLRDLRGKTVGVPGRFGSTYVGLLAGLSLAGLKPSDLSIHTIGFTQAGSVVQGAVDAAVGYSNNEPILLRRRGYQVQTIEIGSSTHLVGPGLLAGNALIRRDPGLVRRFVQATLRGLASTVAGPTAAFAMSRHVHGLDSLHGSDIGDQYAVLIRSVAFWHSPATRRHGLGYADLAQWRQSIALLHRIGQVSHLLQVSAVVTNRFAAGAVRR